MPHSLGMKGKSKKALTPRLAGAATKRSHRTLNLNLSRIVQDCFVDNKKGNITTSVMLTNPKPHRPDFFLEILKSSKMARISPAKFGTSYRLRWDAQDELLSTSSVRELMMSVVEKHHIQPLSADEIQRVNKVFNNISRVRLPTRFSGYALSSTDKMQHPTESGQGYFADSAKTMQRHYELDLQRKARVFEAMEEALKQPKCSFESVMYAGLREAIAFTLNDFTAPITAKDVNPFALKGRTASKTEQDEQVLSREKIKGYFVLLGGRQESGQVDPARPWRDRPGKRLRSSESIEV